MKNNEEAIEKIIKRRKWTWMGHTFKKPHNNITKQPLDFKDSGKTKRERHFTMRRKSIQEEIERQKERNIKSNQKDSTEYK